MVTSAPANSGSAAVTRRRATGVRRRGGDWEQRSGSGVDTAGRHESLAVIIDEWLHGARTMRSCCLPHCHHRLLPVLLSLLSAATAAR